MIRKLMFTLAFLAVVGFAAAQIMISPTITTDGDEIAKGASEASVEQTVTLEIPAATALHLATSSIVFDLTALNGANDDWIARADGTDATNPIDFVCVYVDGPDVGPTGLGSTFWGQDQYVPGGIKYMTDTWPQIYPAYMDNSAVPADQLVVTYPPIRLGSDGKLETGSKDYFVCYQSFIIQLFSNFDYFDLQVSRDDDGGQGIEHLYVQGNTCAEFGVGTGLYDLGDGEYRNLLPKTLNAGPTGTRNTADCNPESSWMDVLGVLAVKVNADNYGTNQTTLTYTLLSSVDQF